MRRRTFITSVACAGLGAVAGSRRILAAETEIELALDRPGAVINPHLYGHFIEHLGGVIYDGIWVGRDSQDSELSTGFAGNSLTT